MSPVRSIFFDTDQCLINTKGELFPGVREVLTELKAYGYNLFCWSRSGHRHIRRMLEKHQLLDLFRFNEPVEYAIIDKPDVFVDDNVNPISGSQGIHIAKPEDWQNFYEKFYNKKVV